MKTRLALIALIIAPLTLSLSHAALASTPTPPIEYTFEGNLNPIESVSGSFITVSPTCPGDPCNDSTSFGTSDGDGYWTWSSSAPNGGGFALDTEDSLTSTYTLLLKFTFDNYSGYRKIIDYLDRSEDTGFYMYNNKINFYNLGTSTSSFTPDVPLTLMVTRTATGATSGIFTVYSYDGTTFTKELEVNDTDGQSIPAVSTLLAGGTKLGFFYDDSNGEGADSGKIWSLKIWPGVALDQAELEKEATVTDTGTEPSPEPEPESTTDDLADTGYDAGLMITLGLLLGLAGFGLVRLSRLGRIYWK